MRNTANKIAVRPATSRVPNDPTVFYRFTETAGATLVDSLGNGADLTFTGHASGTPFANPGYIKFDGTNHHIKSAAAASGVLETIFDLRTDFGAVLIGIDPFHNEDWTTGETLVSIGTNSVLAGALTIQNNAAEVIQMTTRGTGASTTAAAAYTGSEADLTAHNGTRVPILICLRGKSGLTCEADLYVNGAYASTMTLNFAANGGTNFPWLPNGVFIGISAVESGSPTSGRFGAGGASDCRLSRFFAQRHATYDAARVSAIALGIKKNGFDLPSAVFA